MVIFLNDYFKRNIPEKYNEFFINISYKIILIYSKAQIYFLYINNIYNNYIETNSFYQYIKNELFTSDNILKNEIIQIKNNGEIIVKYLESNELNELNLFENFPNSIYIYSDNWGIIKHNCANKIIYHNLNINLDYEISNIKFILFEIKINDKIFKIDLKNEKYNFYIVNNIIDKRFLIYFLKYYQLENNNLNDNLLNDYQICDLKDYFENIEKIPVKLIDQNVNIKEIEISDNQFIVIKKDNYVLN